MTTQIIPNEMTEDLVDEYDFIVSKLTERFIDSFRYIDEDDVYDAYEELIDNEYGEDYSFPEEAPESIVRDVMDEVNDYIQEQYEGAHNNDYLLRSYYQSAM